MSARGRVANTWNEETYNWVMSLRPKGWPGRRASSSRNPGDRWRQPMSIRKAEERTGVPAPTIRGWWSGQRPRFAGIPDKTMPRKTHCLRGLHRLAGDNLGYNPTTGSRLCLACKRDKDRRYGYRQRGTFHPIYNPNPELAPLHCLWVPSASVCRLILETYTQQEVLQIFPKGTAVYRNWYEMIGGKKKWLRFDAADRILSELALNPLGLDREPTYSTMRPEVDPC